MTKEARQATEFIIGFFTTIQALPPVPLGGLHLSTEGGPSGGPLILRPPRILCQVKRRRAHFGGGLLRDGVSWEKSD